MNNWDRSMMAGKLDLNTANPSHGDQGHRPTPPKIPIFREQSAWNGYMTTKGSMKKSR
jgi:hypothetical protein